MTIGECIAIERYGTSELDDRRMTLEEIVLLIDRLRVCKTCGWSEHLHGLENASCTPIGCCEHYDR